MGFTRAHSPLEGMADGDALVIADCDLAGIAPEQIARAGTIVVIGTTLPEIARNAAVVLPVANFAEDEGTFTNLRGRVQRFTQAKAAPGMARPIWWVLGDLLTAMGRSNASFFLASDVFASLAKARPAFAGMSYDSLGLRGATIAEGNR